MQPDEYQSLMDSIGVIGVQNPITLFEGMVLDGWHRYSAANESGMDCPTVELGDTDPRDFVLAQNKARRNLTASQRANAVTSVYQWVASNVGRPRGAAAAPLAKTNAELAAIAGTSVRSVQLAKAVHAGGIPAVQEAVKVGTVTVETAAAVAKLPANEQKKLAAKGPDAMRAAVKPTLVATEIATPPDYAELDATRDQIPDLQDVPKQSPDDAVCMTGLREEVAALREQLIEAQDDVAHYAQIVEQSDPLKEAVKLAAEQKALARGLQSRINSLMTEVADLKRQVNSWKRKAGAAS